jgi:tetratricopeptide (TPR) repeat protein
MSSQADHNDAVNVDVWRLPFDYEAIRSSGYAGSETDALVDLALVLRNTGRTSEAIELLLRASELEPRSSAAYYHLGSIYAQLGDHAAAIEALTTSYEILKHWVTAYRLAGCFAHLDRYEEALAAYSQAAEMNPRAASVFSQRAEVYQKMGFASEAVTDLERALSIEPNSKKLRARLELFSKTKER